MTDPLAEVEFLARSANRIEILATLSEGAYTRRELGDAVDASQPTIGRVLNDLSQRNWISYDGTRYAATPTGAYVAAGITELRDRLTTELRLREVIEYLPIDVVDIGLEAFVDARVTTPTTARPNAPIERMTELLSTADHALLVSHAFNRDKLDVLHDRVDDGLTVRGVFAATAIDAITKDPPLATKLQDVLAAPGVEIRVTDESVPFAIETADDRTHFLLRDEDGVVRASVDTAAEEVREWAESTLARYWQEASPLSPDDLAL